MDQLPPQPAAREEPPYPWEGPWVAVDPGADEEAVVVFVSVDAGGRMALVEPVPRLSGEEA